MIQLGGPSDTAGRAGRASEAATVEIVNYVPKGRILEATGRTSEAARRVSKPVGKSWEGGGSWELGEPWLGRASK